MTLEKKNKSPSRKIPPPPPIKAVIWGEGNTLTHDVLICFVLTDDSFQSRCLIELFQNITYWGGGGGGGDLSELRLAFKLHGCLWEFKKNLKSMFQLTKTNVNNDIGPLCQIGATVMFQYLHWVFSVCIATASTGKHIDLMSKTALVTTTIQSASLLVFVWGFVGYRSFRYALVGKTTCTWAKVVNWVTEVFFSPDLRCLDTKTINVFKRLSELT